MVTLLDGPFFDLLDPPPPPPRPWRTGFFDEQEQRWIQARHNQLPPDDPWYIWLLLAGRGWGKTMTGAQWVLENAMTHPNTEWAVIGKTIGQARDVCIENKRSGLLRCALPGEVKRYVANPCQVDLVNGSRIYVHGSEDADRILGYTLAGAWCDELASWPYPDTWYVGLKPAMRDVSVTPHIVVTTTPRPKDLIKDLLKATPPEHVVRGSTYDNEANLADSYIAQMHADYDGTRRGRQEIHGELLTDNPGALWEWDDIEDPRATDEHVPDMDRIVVAIDPAVTSNEKSDETGIVVAGRHGNDFYVLADYSLKGTPDQWASRAVAGYDHFTADLIVGEMNNGGDLIERTLRTISRNVSYRKVVASRGKAIRAEPVAALYQQHRVHHVGRFPELEKQLTDWDPTDTKKHSPDRLDALVWAVTVLGEGRARFVVYT